MSDTKDFSSATEFQIYLKAWVKDLRPGDIILLSGQMGAGKTFLVRTVVEALGGTVANSPSFALHQRYGTPSVAIDHVDLYRLKNDADLESTGFWDLMDDSNNILFVEWADRLPETVWPRERRRLSLHIEVTGPQSRRMIA